MLGPCWFSRYPEQTHAEHLGEIAAKAISSLLL